jgi:hypothetical protein
VSLFDHSEVAFFVAESNRIEGIARRPSPAELRETVEFIALAPAQLTVNALERFVSVIQPGAKLRQEARMDVRVGNHLPPEGGPHITERLDVLLDHAVTGICGAHETHLEYETLHPFMDGNGRSGRVLWLWQMVNQVGDPHVLRRGFLHTWYYQSLSAQRP